MRGFATGVGSKADIGGPVKGPPRSGGAFLLLSTVPEDGMTFPAMPDPTAEHDHDRGLHPGFCVFLGAYFRHALLPRRAMYYRSE